MQLICRPLAGVWCVTTYVYGISSVGSNCFSCVTSLKSWGLILHCRLSLWNLWFPWILSLSQSLAETFNVLGVLPSSINKLFKRRKSHRIFFSTSILVVIHLNLSSSPIDNGLSLLSLTILLSIPSHNFFTLIPVSEESGKSCKISL